MQTNITISESALRHLRANLANSPQGTLGLKFGLRNAGCSGFAYVLDFASVCGEAEHVHEIGGVKLIIPHKDLVVLHGTHIDLVQQGINSILQFNNPNVVNTCGCGESVQFKEQGA